MFGFIKFIKVTTAILLVLVFAGCSGGGGEIGTSGIVDIPEGGTMVSSLPKGSVLPKGPVLLFTEEISRQDADGRSWPTVALKMKTGKNEPETLIESIGGVGEYPLLFEFSPDNNSIFINLESKLSVFDLGSRTMRDFYKPQKSVSNFIFSPDVTHVLVVDQVYGSLEAAFDLVDVNVADGSAKTIYEGEDTDKFFGLNKWRDDNVVLLSELVGEASVPYTFDVVSKTLQPVPGYGEARLYYGFSDNGKYLYTAATTGEDICNDFSGTAVSAYRLVDPVTGETIGQIDSPGRFMGIMAFSPDDSKVLYLNWAPVTDKNLCDEDTVYSYWQMDLSAGSKVEVNDYQPVIDEWYPENTDIVMEHLSNGYMVYYKGLPYFSTNGMQQIYGVFNNL
ncbi:hypothetical protein KJ951_04795 [Patescibacteria group bacterium]|nr:hypothetical protein [Patescibacteria group bacterium]MBU1703694.1 hypothetical protein [Patescibacteria group bacterium]MBU1953512.1 hypothetical protein [Patescibacteria group bacterium]